MRNFLKTKWLAVAMLLCAPVVTWADGDEELATATVQPEEPTFEEGYTKDLNDGTVTISAAGDYKITGADSTTADSIHFDLGTLSEATKVSLFLHDVKINSTNDCGLYIPASTSENPLTVIIYLYGDNAITGSKYGIYVGENTTLHIRPSGMDGENDKTDATLTINGDSEGTAPAFGIYNLGKPLFIRPVTNTDENTQNTYLWGVETITADSCGIYSPYGLDLDYTYMSITVTGDGKVTDCETLTNDNLPGYTIEKLVCGIYVDNDKLDTSILTNIINASMVQLKIVAAGTDTYGIFIDSHYALNNYGGGNCYFGFGIIDITATRCVLHHEGKSGSYIKAQGWDSSMQLILILNGPYCEHSEWIDDSGNATMWSCEGSISTIAQNNSDTNRTLIVLEDLNDYNYLKDSSESSYTVYEVEYVDRWLYAGWNTLCLPFTYETKSTSTDIDAIISGAGYYTECSEARDYITEYAKFDSYNSDEATLTFKDLDTDANLDPDVAYLVKVDNDVEVKFTVINKAINKVDDDKGEVFKTVFDAETMKGDHIANETSGYLDYKLSSTITENVTTNYFDMAPEDGVDVPAYRAYISVPDNGNEAKPLSIVFDDGETTSIDQLNGGTNADAPVAVYSIDGKLLKNSTTSTATKGLSKGVYVVGGKKVVVM